MEYIPFEPPPGINSDDTTFSARGRWADGDGFRFYQGKAETIGGYLSVTATNMAVNGTKALVYTVSGVVRIAVAGTAKLTTMTTAGTVTNITPSAGQAWNTNSPTQFSLAMWGDNLLAAPSGGTLYESSAGGTAAEIGNAPNQITAMVVTNTRQVMALGCNEETSGTFNGRCIRFSDIEDNTDWTTTSTNNVGEYILPGQDVIVGGAVLGDYVLIWTKGALWLASYTGDPGTVWQFQRVGDVGLVGLSAFAIHHQTAYWVAPDLTFHSYQVGGMITQVPCPISRHFIDNCDISRRSQILACPVSTYGEIWFWFPIAGSDGGHYCSAFSVPESMSAQSPVWFKLTKGMVGISAGTVGAMVESPLLATPFATQGTTTLIIPTATAAFFAVDCRITPVAPLDSTLIQSADFYFGKGERRMMIRGFVPDFEVQTTTVQLQLSARERPRSTANTSNYDFSNTSTKKDFRKSGKLFSITFTNATGLANRIRLGKPQFNVVPMGER